MSIRPTLPNSPNDPRAMMSAHAHDVFFDPTGRRWLLIKVGTLLMMMFLVVALAVSWGPVQQPPPLGSHGHALPKPKLAGLDEMTTLPTIGTGPLVRLVRLDQQQGNLVAIDPLTNQALGPVTGNDADTAGNARYALQQYGYSSAAHKTIALTFDDGPDPTWTPEILDVLGKYKVPATFFVVGSEVAKYPDIVARETREGHTVANHTLTHPDLRPEDVQQQFVSTDHIIRAETGVRTDLVRLPYNGFESKFDPDVTTVLLTAERLKYLVSMEDFDTNDWKYGNANTRPSRPIPYPPTTMDNITMLLHDGGSNRAETVAYLKRLIPWARAHGYNFYSLPQVSAEARAGTAPVAPSLWDRETLVGAEAIWSWPNTLLQWLFVLAIVSVVLGGLINTVLALGRHIRYRRKFSGIRADFTGPPVSIVVPAYNEEKVIGRTIEALCGSRYPNIAEIIVVDDGSADRTAEVVSEMASREPRLRLLRQENMGKAVALNHGFAVVQGDVVVTLDADTVFTPSTVGNLARHFALDTKGRLGAVAGMVKVGNLRNLLTRWQALEYITQIGIDRGAQDSLHAIMVVPGACAAWRRDAVVRAGGYSHATLAEDCDLALALQQQGYAVTQDDAAMCYTEAPETPGQLARQRFRWMYGNIQAMWKHRVMILNPRYGWLGMLTLPVAVISMVVPLVFLPFVYIMAVIAVRAQGWQVVLLYGGLFILAQLVTAAVGVWLAHERPTHLLMVPVYRFIYEPLRAYLLYKSAFTMLRGTRSSWNKLQRRGTVNMSLPEQVGSGT